eukprot:480507_1
MAAVSLEIDDQIKQKWDQIGDANGNINFYITEFVRKPKHALNFFKDGNGGLAELCSVLQEHNNKPLFGILKVVFYDDNQSPYVKFIYFKYVPTRVPVMTKGHLTPRLGKIELQFPVKHLAYMIDEQLDKFDMKHMSIDFDRNTENIVEIDHFEYGPNQTYKWAKKYKVPDMSKVKAQPNENNDDYKDPNDDNNADDQ